MLSHLAFAILVGLVLHSHFKYRRLHKVAQYLLRQNTMLQLEARHAQIKQALLREVPSAQDEER